MFILWWCSWVLCHVAKPHQPVNSVVLPSHIRQWVLHCVSKPYHTVLRSHIMQLVLRCKATSGSEFCVVLPSHVIQLVLRCKATSGSEFCVVLRSQVRQLVLRYQATSGSEFCAVLRSHIRQWVLLHKSEVLECSGGHQNSDLCYKGKIILYMFIRSYSLSLQKIIFVAYEPLFQFHSLLFLAATDDENEITTRTSWLDVSTESEDHIFLYWCPRVWSWHWLS
jgi:hypothetical protein